MLGAGKGPRAHLGGIACNGGFDGRTEIAVALDEFWHARRKPEHVLQNENLAVAGDASADPNRGYRNLPRVRERSQWC